MELQNITIREYLNKNKIPFRQVGNDLVIGCPFCEKTLITGEKLATFHINQVTGQGTCYDCGVSSEFADTIKKIGLKTEIEGVHEGKVEIALKRGSVPQIEVNTAVEEPPVDVSQFKPLSSQDLIEILGLTIKKDEENKLITFLCQLSVYTENSQFNISFNAPSSTGKSYIPTEIARLFPEKDVIEIGYCSPTAFFHDIGEYIKEKGGYLVDLSKKILIFLDQPHTQLLERLRPLLSHDKKEINLKITDKTQKF